MSSIDGCCCGGDGGSLAAAAPAGGSVGDAVVIAIKVASSVCTSDKVMSDKDRDGNVATFSVALPVVTVDDVTGSGDDDGVRGYLIVIYPVLPPPLSSSAVPVDDDVTAVVPFLSSFSISELLFGVFLFPSLRACDDPLNL